MKLIDWWYMLGLVPAVTAAFGYLLFRGSLFTRLLLLNAAIGVGLVIENISSHKNIVAPRVIPDEPGLLVAFAASFTVLFIMINLLHPTFSRYKNARGHSS
jgi:hypothetical protein